MHVLIQNTKTREFYCQPEVWTNDPNSAKQFASTVDALEFLQQTKLKDVHLLMKMGKPEFDVQLRVQSEQDTTEH